MTRWELLWKMARALATVRDIALETRNFRFSAHGAITVYLDVEAADIHIQRQAQPFVDLRVELQAGFGWRLQTEQDDVGVYIVAKRRPVIGQLANAQFWLRVPQDAYFILQLNQCQLCLDELTGWYHIAPQHDKTQIAPLSLDDLAARVDKK